MAVGRNPHAPARRRFGALHLVAAFCMLHAACGLLPPQAARAVSDRPIMAFYYPWWESSDWSGGRTSDLPAPRYSGGDAAVIQRHLQQADDAGLDALICTWYGPDEKRLNERCRQLQDMALASGRDLQIALIPDQLAWPALRSVEGMAAALAVAQRDFMSKPNYLTFQGRPVVFYFDPPSLGGVDTWRQLRQRADPEGHQFWFGGTDNFAYLDVFDALYYFDITWERTPGAAMASYAGRLAQFNRSRGANRAFIATVMPGYDDTRNRGREGHARDREGGAYYRGTWQTAIERNAAAVVVTSFNEFLEGSHIEPSERYGDLYLRLTKELSDKFRAEVGRQSPPGPTPAPQSPPTPVQGDPCQTFPETGFAVCGRILEYWRENGGLPVFGLPLGPQHGENIEGQVFQVQQFERNRMELHPEQARPYDVLLGRLGAEALAKSGRDWQSFPKVEGAASGCLFFAQTGHSLCEPFLSAWRRNGLELDGQRGFSVEENMALFGLPLSEPQEEQLSDGKLHAVQWFERARFESHPDNPDPYKVLLGRLGAE